MCGKHWFSCPVMLPPRYVRGRPGGGMESSFPVALPLKAQKGKADGWLFPGTRVDMPLKTACPVLSPSG